MSNADLIKLYSQRILELAADIPHSERLEAPQASVSKRSPLCGSMATVDIVTQQTPQGLMLSQLGMDVKACALGQASASIFGACALGKTQAELIAARDGLRAMLKEGAPAPQGDFAELEVLSPAQEYRNRHASIMLVWDAVVEAMEMAGAAQKSRPSQGGSEKHLSKV